MKNSARVKKILKQMEIEDNGSWLSAHSNAWGFINAILQEEDERVSKEMYKKEDYDSPNWMLLKADQGGQRRLINKLINIFKD